MNLEQRLTLSRGSVVLPLEEGRFALRMGEQVAEIDGSVARVIELFDGLATVSDVRSRARATGVAVSDEEFEGLVDQLLEHGALTDAEALPERLLPGGRVHCIVCPRSTVNCCHLSIGPLDPGDVERIETLDWEGKGLERLAREDWLAERRAGAFLKRHEDGPCVFLDPDGLCRIHKHFGLAAKPLTCQLYPLVPLKIGGETRVGLDYDCTGLAYTEREGSSDLSAEVQLLRGVIDGVLEHEEVEPDPDPLDKVARAVAEAPRDDPHALLRGAAEALLPTLFEGGLTLATLLADLSAVTARFGEKAAAPKIRAQMNWLVEGISAFEAGETAPSLSPTEPDAGPIRRYLLAYVENQLWLGDALARHGAAVALTEVILALVVGRHRAERIARAEGRDALTLDDVATGLSNTVGALRTLRLVRGLSGGGAKLLSQALSHLPSYGV